MTIRNNARNVHALSVFLRPNVGDVSARWRRVLEPVVAVLALGSLAILIGIAAVNLFAFMLVGGLIVLILTRVFGLNLRMA
jgi:hypothetical protein